MNWQQWITSFSGVGNQRIEEIGFLPFLGVMALSLLCSLLVSFLYVRFCKSKGTGSQIHRAFPLLGVSVTSIFICIQFSLPLSLGLLGALSIVRFRTPIKEPEEIGFIMIVVAMSLACATFNVMFLGIILLVVLAALLVMSIQGGLFGLRPQGGTLILSMPTREYTGCRGQVHDFLEKELPSGRMDSITENNEESVVTYRFNRLDRVAMEALQAKLENLAPGLQSNLFFDYTGAL
ncbi:MAG: DUF4956 domain-containing protein [Lentisphaerae bacterium]|nr:DUF4956 domain-containing protein [Lentisphaerota bacterium]